MTRQINERILKLEARRRPAVVHVSKHVRDALVRRHLADGRTVEASSPVTDELSPNRAAAIAAAWKADT